MTNASMAQAFQILGHFWLEEVQVNDLSLIAALPELGDTVLDAGEAALDELAVEYQKLFGFNVPPYESVFVDPSSLLMAPATAQVQALYRHAGWQPPAHIRAGAVDHIGLELLAFADLVNAGRDEFAQTLLVQHLALWVPALTTTLMRITPHPFYETLAELTLHLILANLDEPCRSKTHDPFPALPPAPVYTASSMWDPDVQEEYETSLSDLVGRLLIPRESGLYITRQDINCIGSGLDLPTIVGERSRMLTTLFRLSGQYDLLPALHYELSQLFDGVAAIYQLWSDEYPAWNVYSHAWKRRLASGKRSFAELATADLPSGNQSVGRT